MRIDSKRTIAMIAGVALTACLGLAACSAENTGSNLSETGDSQANTEQVSVASGQNDPYVSDDACLGCHGGTYESVAARTESYGDSNPHDSVHGGYLSCNVCHARGNAVTSNYCLECHDWPRDLDCNPYD